MTTISIVHTKGGVGKTTSAIYLATVAHLRGVDVVVVDADPQGSAVQWHKRALTRRNPLPFEVLPTDERAGLKIPEGRELVIVDTPPGRSPLIPAAIEIADLVLIPCGASPMDAERVGPTLDLTAGYPTLVLMTGVDFRSSLWKGVKADVDTEATTTKTVIPGRSEIKRSFGTVPTKFFGYDDLLTELVG